MSIPDGTAKYLQKLTKKIIDLKNPSEFKVISKFYILLKPLL
ncbi:hypothetical protein CKA32_006036 [Geitlerinema sp. FC II]|nr:hypothetical protein CKA32_006036 [Geitlerinema sp. FC II]